MPDLKGKQGGNCNRTACQQPGAFFAHKDGLGYYCYRCARSINEQGRICGDAPVFALTAEERAAEREWEKKTFLG